MKTLIAIAIATFPAAAQADWVEMKASLESKHPHPAGLSSKNIWVEGASQLRLRFRNLDLDSGDRLVIRDAQGNTLQTLTGSARNLWTQDLPGEKFKLTVEDDGIIQRRGYIIDRMAVDFGP